MQETRQGREKTHETFQRGEELLDHTVEKTVNCAGNHKKDSKGNQTLGG